MNDDLPSGLIYRLRKVRGREFAGCDSHRIGEKRYVSLER